MENAAIYDKLTAVFRTVFEDDSLVVAPELTARDVSEWDSLGHIRLIIATEKAFGVRFKTSEINGFENVGQLVDLIAEKIGGP